MVSSIDDVLEDSQTIVIGNAAPEFRDVPRRLSEGQTVIDLVRIADFRSISGVYEGICW
jgi:GDP-mannose 6-dehydrogenase